LESNETISKVYEEFCKVYEEFAPTFEIYLKDLKDTFELFFFPISQPATAVKTLLDIIGVEYSITTIALNKGEHK